MSATFDPPRTLNLGCGRKRMANAINVDVSPDVSPDMVVDLNHRPWPFPERWFTEVHAYDVIEHLGDVIATMEEIHRVACPGAIIHLTVPHFSSANAFTDPTHRHWFGYQSFHYLTGESEHGHYTRARFRRRCTNLVFAPTLANKVVRRLARAWPLAYEQRWAWMFPAWFIYVELEAIAAET